MRAGVSRFSDKHLADFKLLMADNVNKLVSANDAVIAARDEKIARLKERLIDELVEHRCRHHHGEYETCSECKEHYTELVEKGAI